MKRRIQSIILLGSDTLPQATYQWVELLTQVKNDLAILSELIVLIALSSENCNQSILVDTSSSIT